MSGGCLSLWLQASDLGAECWEIRTFLSGHQGGARAPFPSSSHGLLSVQEATASCCTRFQGTWGWSRERRHACALGALQGKEQTICCKCLRKSSGHQASGQFPNSQDDESHEFPVFRPWSRDTVCLPATWGLVGCSGGGAVSLLGGEFLDVG